MVQPDVATGFLSEPILRDQGLLSRLLVAAPESLAGTRIWRETSKDPDPPMRRYIGIVLGLLEFPASAANEAGNELTPRTFELSTEANAAWVAFHDQIERAMAEDSALEYLRDVAGKAAENAARIAAVLTIVETPDASIIEANAMSAGCELMTWYVFEALRLSGAHRQPPTLRHAIKLLEWLRAKHRTQVTRSEIMQFGPASVRQKADADPASAVLEDHGWLVRAGDGKAAKWDVAQGPAQISGWRSPILPPKGETRITVATTVILRRRHFTLIEWQCDTPLRMINDVIIRKEHRRRKKAVGFQVWISAPDVSREATPLESRGEKLTPMSADRLPFSIT